MNRRRRFVRWRVLISVCWIAIPGFAQTPTPFFSEGFDAVAVPVLPGGWVDAAGIWETDDGVASPGSGANNLRIRGKSTASIQTPPINLSHLTSGVIRYLARRTSTYATDALTLTASTDGGASFPHVLLTSGSALPASDGAYETLEATLPAALVGAASVVFRFEATGGTTTGANIRVDDVVVEGESEGGSTFGFTSATSSIDGASGQAQVPLYLDYTHDTQLRGFQAEFSFSDDELAVDDVVPGPAIDDASAWRFSFEDSSGRLRVMALAQDGQGLSASLQDPFFTIQFSTAGNATVNEATVTLSNAVGALKVPTGDDAGILLGLATHSISLIDGDATFAISPAAPDMGTVTAGESGDLQLTVTNPSGAADLSISAVTSSNPNFAVTPNEATIPPGGESMFTLSFSPTIESFGLQEADLTFTHNAGDGTDVVNATGLGVGGRGDADVDGLVDVVDLVLGIDYVLGRLEIMEEELPRLDIYPFSSGDGAVDVRDMTVLAEAITLGAWPDEVGLPIEPSSTVAQDHVRANVVTLILTEVDGAWEFAWDSPVPLRGIQASLGWDDPAVWSASAPSFIGTTLEGEAYSQVNQQSLRLLQFRIDGKLLSSERPLLGALSGVVNPNLKYAIAVSGDGQRMPVVLEKRHATDAERPIALKPVSASLPFPNPFHPVADRLVSIELDIAETLPVMIDVIDVMGRKVAVLLQEVTSPGRQVVTWDGQGHGQVVAPGLYFLRIQAGKWKDSQMLVVN